ncbi:PocR ligand-binding domain-containing protein [Thermosulfuriphilus sp.]
MNQLKLDNLLPLGPVKRILETFARATGVAVVLLDAAGTYLTSINYSRLCRKFHHQSPGDRRRCQEFARNLGRDSLQAKGIIIRQCHNYLYDGTAPIIVGDQCLGFVGCGQIFVKPPDYEELAKIQAARYGVSEEEYLSALREVPIIPEERFHHILALQQELASYISSLAYSALRQEERIRHQKLVLEQGRSALFRIFDHLRNPIYSINRQWRITYANQALKRLLEDKDLEGEKCYRLFFGLDEPCPWCFVKDILGGSQARLVNLKIKDREFVSLGVPFPDLSGETWVVNTFYDVTTEEQWRRALRKINSCLLSLGPTFEENVALIVNTALDLLKARSGGYLRLEGEALKPYFSEPAEVTLPPGLLEFRFRGDHPIEIVARDPDFYVLAGVSLKGRPIGLLWFQIPLKPDNQSVELATILVEALRREEERNRYHRALETNLNRMRALLRAIPYTIFRIDENDRLIEWSAEDPPKFLVSASLGKRLDKLFGSQIGRRLLKKVRQARSKQEITDLEFEVRTTKGIRYYRSHHCPVEGTGEVVSVIEDITEDRLLQDNLLQLQKMEGLGRLAGGIAHDFNNLLMGIMGQAELLLLEEEGPLRRRAEEIIKTCKRGAELVQQLLAFGRRQQPQFEVLDLNRLLKEMAQMLTRLIGEDVELCLDLSPELWSIKGDRVKIQQVILNLVVNARDAMPQGGVLTIRTGNQKIGSGRSFPGGQYVVLSFEDTGSGIPKHLLPLIFEPFFTTKEVGQGSGLGLAIAHSIVSQHGGFIEVSSEKKKGTVFSIYFPRTRARPKKPGIQKVSSPVASSGRVLVVDDEESVCQILSEMLESLGYQIKFTLSSKEALNILKKEVFDLLISDVVMPQMSGPELAVRARKIRPEIKIIYISGYAGELLSRYGVREEECLTKPITLEALSLKVREVLKGASG